MKRYWWIPVVTLAAIGLIWLYRSVNPQEDFMPKCVFRRLTGWSCPGCGSQRFAHALFNGHALEAVSYNYFLPVGIVIIAVSAWLEATRRRHPERYRKAMQPLTLYLVVALLVAWTILRNVLGV